MTFRIHLSSEAQAELAEVIRWYEERRQGLGRDLLTAVARTLSVVARRPDIGGSVPGVQRPDAKRLLVPRAVAHLKRRPGYWRKRS